MWWNCGKDFCGTKAAARWQDGSYCCGGRWGSRNGSSIFRDRCGSGRRGFGDHSPHNGVSNVNAPIYPEDTDQEIDRTHEQIEVIAALEVLEELKEAKGANEGEDCDYGNGPVQRIVTGSSVVVGVQAAHGGKYSPD